MVVWISVVVISFSCVFLQWCSLHLRAGLRISGSSMPGGAITGTGGADATYSVRAISISFCLSSFCLFLIISPVDSSGFVVVVPAVDSSWRFPGTRLQPGMLLDSSDSVAVVPFIEFLYAVQGSSMLRSFGGLVEVPGDVASARNATGLQEIEVPLDAIGLTDAVGLVVGKLFVVGLPGGAAPAKDAVGLIAGLQ